MTTRNVPIGQLQTVINSSVAGDVLNLAPGLHKSTTGITVNKRLTVDGLDAATVSAPGDTILVRAADITFQNVKVTGATGVNSGLFSQTQPNLTLRDVILEGVGDPLGDVTQRTVFGIRAYRTGATLVSGGEWSKLALGVQFESDGVGPGGAGSVIEGVHMHDFDRMRVMTPTGGDDTGGNPLAFFQAKGPIIVRNNKIERARAPSFDYHNPPSPPADGKPHGKDGAAFEMYGGGSGGLLIEGNEIVDCLLICETGKSSGQADYDNVTFRGNTFRSTNPAPLTSADMPNVCNGIFLRSAKNWTFEDNTFRDIDWWIFAFDYSSTSYSGALSNIIARRNTVYLKPGVNRWLSFSANVPMTVFSSADNKVYQQAGGTIAERPNLKTADLATWRNGAAGHETGASYWGVAPVTPPPVVTPPPITDPNLAKISQLEAQVASLTTSLAQANTALATANAATNAAQQQRDAYLAKLNALRASVTTNVADLNAANTAAQP